MKEDVETLKNDWLTDNVCRHLLKTADLAADHVIAEYKFLGRVRVANLAYAASHPAYMCMSRQSSRPI